MTHDEWPPFSLPKYLGSAHFQDQMLEIAKKLNHEYVGVSGEDAVFEAVANFVSHAHRTAKEGNPFEKRFPNEAAVRRYIKVAATRNAIRRRRRLQREVPYDPEILESMPNKGLEAPDVLVKKEEAEQRSEIIAYIAQIFHGEREEEDPAGLTRHEHEVMRRTLSGETVREIALAMKKSLGAVSMLRMSAITKLRRKFRL